MAEASGLDDPVMVSAPLLLDVDVAALQEVSDDALNGALSDTDLLGHLPQSHVRIPGDAEEHMGVVAEKSPLLSSVLLIHLPTDSWRKMLFFWPCLHPTLYVIRSELPISKAYLRSDWTSPHRPPCR